MANFSNISVLRFGFDLDKSSFLDIGNRSVDYVVGESFIFQPFPLFILLRKSRTMSAVIRRGYIAMHSAYITYDVIFFFLARIYVLMPWSGLYCEGLLCRIGSHCIFHCSHPASICISHYSYASNADAFGFLAQTLEKLTLMTLNVVGFVTFGQEPDNIDLIIQEPEIEFYAKRGKVLLFGSPGYPQYMKAELVFFYITLLINFPVLCAFIFHSMINLRKTSINAKSTQTQRLTQIMFEVFFLQLSGVTFCHVIPLMTLMTALWVDIGCFGNVPLATCKLVLLLLLSYFWSLRRMITNSKVEPGDILTPIKQTRHSDFSMIVLSETPSELLTVAIQEAIVNVDMISLKAKENIGADRHPTFQQGPSEEAVELQQTGDILQETTRILIEKHGADILTKLENVDALAALDAQLDSQDGAKRKKRQATDPGTISTSDPLDLSCIDRPPTCDRRFPYRSISGWCNHDDTANRGWGSTMAPIRRFMGVAKYDDGFNSVRRRSANGGVLPSTRDISNKIFAEASIPSFDPRYNHFLQQFGQWIAHDIVFTPTAVGPNGAGLDCSLCESANITSNCAPIEVPANDEFFPTRAPNGRQGCIRMTRAINGQTALGPRAQINQNTHFLDLSLVYGSTDCVAKELRTNRDGQMIMFTADGFNLPPRAANDSNCQSQTTRPQFLCFTAGDIRNSLHPGLIPLHTIYLRQHNRWAAQIRQLRPEWSDNLVYQETRRLMIALYQHHVYSEYLPKIVGQRKMRELNLTPRGLRNHYDSTVNPSVAVEFCSAAFRFGHSQARRDIPRTTNNNLTVGAKIDLGQHIFYSDPLYDRTATVSTMTMGMVNSPGMASDRQFSFPMRHEMFATRGRRASGIDLPAVNVMRGREKGIQPYNEIRARIPGLSPVASFDALRREMDQANIELLRQTYDSVDDIDLYVGLLLERPTDPTALLGPTGSHLIADQLSAFKRGDRFFYENTATPGALSQAEYNAIRTFSLAQLICENTEGMELVQRDIFQHNDRQVRCSSFQPFPMARIIF
ncbi:hypothetical protein PRIPAC_79392 [Pristionchus pacificus]|uniref:G protein-coupled receptor n=1 Tax=Pristionchus pacificus TaxID=54126 RepID=A0A2A6C400_PRIPA|nr:hypothetical protein PRIPAC_79392 [Pristionchus pacificus]|eukprot:PDM72828.1 G protein-coupled receptor [Pristionchus pacificus]